MSTPKTSVGPGVAVGTALAAIALGAAGVAILVGVPARIAATGAVLALVLVIVGAVVDSYRDGGRA